MAILYCESPRRLARRTVIGGLAVLLCGAAALLIQVDMTESRTPKATPPFARIALVPAQRRDTTDVVCDVRCEVGPASAVASRACLSAIEDLAAFGVRWSRTSEERSPFDRFEWRSGKHAALALGGSAAEFRNGSGTYLPVDYECEFDIATAQVIEARARPRGT